MGRRNHPEDDLQREVARLLDAYGLLWMHTPNGGRRGKIEAARLKGLGVKPGVPDILIFEPWQGYTSSGFGVAIELKAGRNKPNANQVRWLDDLERRGWYATVCRSMAEVDDILAYVRAAKETR